MTTKLPLLLFVMLFSLTIKAQCTRTASFQNGDYVVSGSVSLVYTTAGDKMVEIQNDFSTMSGPDLRLYLANTPQISTAQGTPPGTVDLGLLGPVSGSSIHIIPSNVNIEDYAYLILQCTQFNAFWGNAMFGAIQGPDCDALSLNEHAFNGFNFYPNPVTHGVYISGSITEDININIYDSLGNLVVEHSGINSQNRELSLAELSSGMYFIEFSSNDQSNVKKLIIK